MKNISFNNFSYVAIGRIIKSAILAIFFLIFATILEPNDFGKFGYLVALAVSFSVVSRFWASSNSSCLYCKRKKTWIGSSKLTCSHFCLYSNNNFTFHKLICSFSMFSIFIFLFVSTQSSWRKKIQEIPKKFNFPYHTNFYYFIPFVFYFRYSRNFTRYGTG